MQRIIFVAIFILFCSCSQKKDKNIILSNDSSADSVSQILEYSTITAYRDGNKLWVLRSQNIIQLLENNKIKANPVHLTIFGDSAQINAVLTADSGLANGTTDSLFVWGNVKINGKNGEKLSSPTLEWNKKKGTLNSDDFVELTSADGEIMRGKGFTADESFEWWEFAKEVSGNFPSFENDLKKDGK